MARGLWDALREGLVLPPWEGGDAVTELRRAALAGAERRYGLPLPAAVTSRLDHELAVIDTMRFSSYFLVVRDIVGPFSRTCGRGSGAASLVAYCLGITNVCPVRHNLYFERFLNPGRLDPPDIDIDFAWDERDRVLASVLERFGCRAAMVSCHVGLQPRLAIRETARVFGLPAGEIGRVTKKLPWLWRADPGADDYLDTLRTLPQLREVDLGGPWPEILRLAARISGAPRHLSVHPGGVVVTPEPVSDYAPVQRTTKGVPVLQWDKDSAEEAGLVKIDLLGNRSLGVIRDAVARVRAGGVDFDELRWQPLHTLPLVILAGMPLAWLAIAHFPALRMTLELFQHLLAALLVSALIGLVAGVAPARHAARLNPIESLRTE